jgi:uncharacterized protein (TIGR00156 family)
MRTASALLFIISIFVSGAIWAQYRGPGAGPLTTAAAANRARYPMSVVLTGHIVEQIGEEDYNFRDHTGVIWMKIGKGLWDERYVTPETTVRITGKIVLEWIAPKIDAEKLEVISVAGR